MVYVSAENVHISANGSVITVVGAHHKNQGSYRCMASNAYGAVDSAVTLVVEGEWRKQRSLCGSS